MIPRISGARAQHRGRAVSATHAQSFLPRWLILPIALLLAATPAPLSVGSADPARFLDDIKALTVPAMEARRRNSGASDRDSSDRGALQRTRARSCGDARLLAAVSRGDGCEDCGHAVAGKDRAGHLANSAKAERGLRAVQFFGIGHTHRPARVCRLRHHSGRVFLRRLRRRRCEGQDGGDAAL